eukprot:TRINITY_DN9377_c0_g1_i3.p1 TRINITY_DN9377_c0_g1~~TRINITY_DN9377_c0_g1_i3.p1  ORF type:complete len:292 (-),score=88.81 TRINITY_DN9377_c0_g1_i3:301-1176(-)
MFLDAKDLYKEKASLPVALSTPFICFLTLLMIYFKLEKSLDVSWWICFIPSYLFLLIRSIKCVYYMLREHVDKDLHVLKEKIYLLSHFLSLLIYICAIVVLYLFGEYLDAEESGDDAPRDQLFLFSFLGASLYLVYGWYMDNLNQELQTGKSVSMLSCITHGFMFMGSGVNSLLNLFLAFLSSSFFVCTGGACNSMYISTLSSFFGAVGVSVVDWLPYLDGLTVLMIGISLFSLYAVNRSWTYKPFAIGLIGSLMIVTNMIFFKPKYLLYGGNVMLVTAAIWNSKLSQATI